MSVVAHPSSAPFHVERISVTIEQLAEWLALAEQLGGWRALHDTEDELGRIRYLCERAIDRPTREARWVGFIRGDLAKRNEHL